MRYSSVIPLLTAVALALAARIVRHEGIWFDPAFSLRKLLTGRGGGSA